MVAAASAHDRLPDSAYAMWLRGELDAYLQVPDGTRVEVIGGEVFVSPCPPLGHNVIIADIEWSVAHAKQDDRGSLWQFIHNTDVDLVEICDGYIPDLMILRAEVLAKASSDNAARLLPDQVGLVVEVTSRSNACNDRPPAPRTRKATKWTGYARSGVPYYLLVDRDPRVGQAILYGRPDRQAGRYETVGGWEFGKTIRLPEPFGFDIPTDRWSVWQE